jgi:hypothetical protein
VQPLVTQWMKVDYNPEKTALSNISTISKNNGAVVHHTTIPQRKVNVDALALELAEIAWPLYHDSPIPGAYSPAPAPLPQRARAKASATQQSWTASPALPAQKF